MKFQVGDNVEWTSHGSGNVKTKRGEVVEVIRSRGVPQIFSSHRKRYKIMFDIPLNYRGHESYLVAVETKSGRGRPRLYWPRVSLLRKSIPEETAIDYLEKELLQESDLIEDPRKEVQL